MPAYGPLRLKQDGNLVVLQPVGSSGQSAPTLSINLTSRKVDATVAPTLSSKAEQVLALLGVMRFKAGVVVVLATEAQQVAELRGQPVFKVTKTKVVKPPGKFDAGESRLLGYLADAVNPEGSGRNMFLSYGDITLSTQRLADVLADPVRAQQAPAARADPQFFWNRQLCQPLLEAGAAAFAVTCIVGSVGAVTGLQLQAAGGAPLTADLMLVARRSADRCGTRHWRRGADPTGAVANFVETEQIVSVGDGSIVGSFVQVRGSIPIIWTQIPNIKYKPPTKILEGKPTSAAFDAHMDAVLSKYKAASCINLVNQHGSEGKLEAAFAKEAARYKRTKGAPLTYTAFDFHKECGAKNYGRLSLLWEQLEDEYQRFGMYISSSSSSSSSSSAVPGASLAPGRQAGVFRTNCVDCLDRTNVVQGVLGRMALEGLLQQLGVLKPGAALATALPAVEARFKVLWADHGDDISRQYAGTGALKSGFTRTGKRTLGGLVDDGIKSIGRYYLNNFQDGHKQDALDLMTGSYKPKPDVKLRFQKQHSPALPLLAVLLAVGYAVHGITLAASGRLLEGEAAAASSGGGVPPLLKALGQHIALPLLAAGVLLGLVVKNGKWLVDRPQLCPQLANTVAYAADNERVKQT